MNKIQSIEPLRGIAALMVCIFHLVCGNPNFLTSENIVYKIASFGYLGVEIFFVISGFVIPYSLYKSNYKLKYFKEYITKRIIRIQPPYLFSIMLVFILNYIASKAPGFAGTVSQFNISQFLSNIFYTATFFNYEWYQPVYWTLLIEFQFYLLLGFTFFLLTNKKTSIILIILLSILHHLINISLFTHINPFIIGILLFLVKTHILNKKEGALFLLILLIKIALLKNLPEVFATIFAILFIIFFNYKSVLLIFLGKISFSLYLTHCIIGGKIINLSLRLVENNYQKYLAVFISIVLSILFAYIFYIYIEKKAIKYSQSILYNKDQTIKNELEIIYREDH